MFDNFVFHSEANAFSPELNAIEWYILQPTLKDWPSVK